MSNMPARNNLRLVPPDGGVADEPATKRELRLLEAAGELSEAVEHVRRAVSHAGALLPDVELRGLLERVGETQVRVAEELGRAVGSRVAASYRWNVQAGIDVPELD